MLSNLKDLICDQVFYCQFKNRLFLAIDLPSLWPKLIVIEPKWLDLEPSCSMSIQKKVNFCHWIRRLQTKIKFNRTKMIRFGTRFSIVNSKIDYFWPLNYTVTNQNLKLSNQNDLIWDQVFCCQFKNRLFL